MNFGVVESDAIVVRNSGYGLFLSSPTGTQQIFDDRTIALPSSRAP